MPPFRHNKRTTDKEVHPPISWAPKRQRVDGVLTEIMIRGFVRDLVPGIFITMNEILPGNREGDPEALTSEIGDLIEIHMEMKIKEPMTTLGI